MKPIEETAVMTPTFDRMYQRELNRMSRRFVNGLLVLVPVIITLFVIEWTLRFTEGVLGQYLPFYFPGMGIITLILVIYAVGWASTNWALAKIISLGETLIGTIPFVKFIYTSVKRLSEAVLDSSSNFKRVVHIPYLPPRFQEAMGGGYICVFVPWSLNMTSGTTLLVREEDAVTIDIPKEEALQYMLTAGAVMPLDEVKKKPPQKKVSADIQPAEERRGTEV